MKNAWKFALLGAAAVSLIPFKLERDENGDFEYRSLLLGVTRKTSDTDGQASLSFHFFNLPKFDREEDLFDDDFGTSGRDDPKEDGVLIIAEDEADEAEEAPKKETPKEETPKEEAPKAPAEEAKE